MNRRLALAAAALVLAVAGCTPAGVAPEENRPPASPWDALLQSTKGLTTTSYKAKATLPGGIAAEATIDPVARVAMSKASLAIPNGPSITQEQIIIGTDSYTKFDIKNLPQAPAIPNAWMTVDVSKVEEDRADYTLDDPDPARLAAEVFKGLSNVERNGDRGVKGRLDLGKATKSGIVDADAVIALKDQATSVPFEATMDDQGRILTFQIMVPAVDNNPAQVWSVTYSDYGTPVKATKPENAIPAPPALYEFLNG